MWLTGLRSLAVIIPLAALGWGVPGFAQADDPGDRFRAWGEITAVEQEAGAFSLHTRAGEDLRVEVNDETRFLSRRGEIDRLEDLQRGMKAAVRGHVEADGSHIARIVAVGDGERRPGRIRFRGTLESVAPDRGNFSISTLGGEVLEFLTDDRTGFHSRDGSVDSLADLQPGLGVAVAALKQDDGSLLAVEVFAGSEDRKLAVRMAGTIIGLGERQFRLETRAGETIAFVVDDSSTFKSRDGSVTSFGDLEEGMHALVGAKENASGGLTAVWVGVRNPEKDRDRPRPTPDPVPEGGRQTPPDGRSSV